MSNYRVTIGCKKCQTSWIIDECDITKLKHKLDRLWDEGCPECGEEASGNVLLLDIE